MHVNKSVNPLVAFGIIAVFGIGATLLIIDFANNTDFSYLSSYEYNLDDELNTP